MSGGDQGASGMFGFEAQDSPLDVPTYHYINGELTRYQTVDEVRSKFREHVGETVLLSYHPLWRGSRARRVERSAVVERCFEKYVIVCVSERRKARLETFPYADFLTGSARISFSDEGATTTEA